MTDELVKRLNENKDFIDFRDWLILEINKLDSVEGLDKMSNSDAGEEAKVRNKAKDKLLEILSPFINIREEREPSIEEVQKAKDKRGL